jgi:MoaA/NifB/PqqE/SkfB family radical SAM enzyme
VNIPRDPNKTIASVFLLPKCDMGCTFCASDLGFDRMRFEQACELFAALRGAGYTSLVLGGGEPALWRDGEYRLSDLGLFAKGLGFTVQMNTNGIRLPDGYVDWPGIDRFIFPMDGASAGAHDSLRVILGTKPGGHFDLVQTRIAECTEAGQEITIGTVLTSENRDQLPQLIEWMRQRLSEGAKLHAWHLYRFLPVGRGGVTAGESLALSHEDFREACREAKGAGLPFPVWRRDDMLRSSSVEFFWYEGGELKVGTTAWSLPDPARQA